MESERFSVPEVLFHPSDIGMEMAGISEATWQGLSKLDDVNLLFIIFYIHIDDYFRSL